MPSTLTLLAPWRSQRLVSTVAYAGRRPLLSVTWVLAAKYLSAMRRGSLVVASVARSTATYELASTEMSAPWAS
ncbi:hypothetical protein D3C86_1108550 [compost metagenome]